MDTGPVTVPPTDSGVTVIDDRTLTGLQVGAMAVADTRFPPNKGVIPDNVHTPEETLVVPTEIPATNCGSINLSTSSTDGSRS